MPLHDQKRGKTDLKHLKGVLPERATWGDNGTSTESMNEHRSQGVKGRLGVINGTNNRD